MEYSQELIPNSLIKAQHNLTLRNFIESSDKVIKISISQSERSYAYEDLSIYHLQLSAPKIHDQDLTEAAKEKYRQSLYNEGCRNLPVGFYSICSYILKNISHFYPSKKTIIICKEFNPSQFLKSLGLPILSLKDRLLNTHKKDIQSLASIILKECLQKKISSLSILIHMDLFNQTNNVLLHYELVIILETLQSKISIQNVHIIRASSEQENKMDIKYSLQAVTHYLENTL
jgi:hypothetical protein